MVDVDALCERISTVQTTIEDRHFLLAALRAATARMEYNAWKLDGDLKEAFRLEEVAGEAESAFATLCDKEKEAQDGR